MTRPVIRVSARSSPLADPRLTSLLHSRSCHIDALATGLNLDKNTMKDVYTKFGLEAGTQDFVGHAMALYLDDRCGVLLE